MTYHPQIPRAGLGFAVTDAREHVAWPPYLTVLPQEGLVARGGARCAATDLGVPGVHTRLGYRLPPSAIVDGALDRTDAEFGELTAPVEKLEPA